MKNPFPQFIEKKQYYDSSLNFNKEILEESTSQPDSMPLLCSGFGKCHTNGPNKRNRKLYTQINPEEIRKLVDYPQEVDKSEAQWLIPSTLSTRIFNEQEANGVFYIAWVDIDENTIGIHGVAEIIERLIPGCNYEIYTTKAATASDQRCRILILLNKPLLFYDWNLCQEILNDKLESNGIIPDRASERAAQLCYLPNRGEFYDSKSKRDGKTFDPMLEWAEEIRNKREEIAQQIENLEKRRKESRSNRDACNSYSDTKPQGISEFN